MWEWRSGSLIAPLLSQANAAIPANSLEQYVYAIQEVYNNTNEPTTYVQNSTSGSSGIISRISGFVGARLLCASNTGGRCSGPAAVNDAFWPRSRRGLTILGTAGACRL